MKKRYYNVKITVICTGSDIMPSYVSHTIMAREVFKKLKDSNANLDYMITYSLGGDLTKFSKCRSESHKQNKREIFFNNLIYFVKKNNLETDPKVLGFIYGHICHYAFDDIMHPLVRKVSKTCKKNKKNHAYVELIYDNYLVNKKYNLPLNKYNNKVLFKGKINKDIKRIINYSYKETYGYKNISKYYKINIWLYKKIKLLYLVFSFNFLKNVTGTNKFLKNNKNIDLYNNNHKLVFKDINGKESRQSFDYLYKKSIEKALNDIEEINNKLKP